MQAVAISPEELEAALSASDLLSSDPGLELGPDDAAWRTRAQRLRGHLSIRLEFALALAVHPGASSPDSVLDEANSLLVNRYAELQTAFLNAAKLTPSTNETHRPEAFRLSRLAAKWACHLWVWEHFRGVAVGAEFSNRVLAGFESMPVPGDEPVAVATRASTSLSVVAKTVDAISRFDFLHADRDALLRACVDRIYAKARQAIEAESTELDRDEASLDSVVRAAADVFVAVYLQEARAFRSWLLAAPKEAAAHRLYVAEIVGGLDMTPVYQQFDRAFDYAMGLSLRKAELARSVVQEQLVSVNETRG
jgi:hypothetical protein